MPIHVLYSEPGKVMNVRSYVYHPLLDDMTKITALIVWDGLSFVDAGGTVSHYVVVIKRNEDTVLVSFACVNVFPQLQWCVYL